MKKLFIFFLLSNLVFSMSSEEILTKLDYNMTPKSVSYNGEMIIHRGNKKYTKKFIMDADGNEKSFIVFKYPARDKGTKYLRNGKNIWIYMPSTSRTIKISKHMLKENMMGSDISYDDQTDRNKYSTLYNSKIINETPTQYVLDLIRKDGEEAKYYKQILWINKNTLTIDKGEMYANSGKLLKEYIVDEITKIEDRYYITIFRIDDKLKKNSYTELILTEIKLNPDLSDSIFTLKNLEKR